MARLTKAQKAAKAGIQHLLNEMIIGIKIDRSIYPIDRIKVVLHEIDVNIKEYGLNDNFLDDYVDQVYKALYNARRYLDAAAIAKKYEL